MMTNIQEDPLLQVETTCGSLLYELQIIWDEVGESETDKDKMLLELERECLEVYRRKVDQANRCRTQLRQAIADSEAELAAICSVMGERPVHIRQTEHKAGSLKDELNTILPQLEEIQKRKLDRKNQFLAVIGQIQKVSMELYGSAGNDRTKTTVDENDLSHIRLEELQGQLQSLEKEKNDRLAQVMEHHIVLSSLCTVLGLDFKKTMREIHPSLGEAVEKHSISADTFQKLEISIKRLRELKLQRMKRLQELATMLLELWNLMDTPIEEQQTFQNVTCHIAASEEEINEPNMVSEDIIKYVEEEVYRLEALKSSKMKELVLKKRLELEEICRKTHLVPGADSEMKYLIAAIESESLDPASALEQIELEVAKVKEEAFSRKEVLEKVEKWLSAREEEEWLEEYNMDENRFNAGRGAHLTLKRAERARALVHKLPGMVEALAAKVLNWQNERGVEFLYDGVRMLSMLEDYILFRQEKEEEKKRQREQKKLQGQLIAEQETLFGSKPSPLKSSKKASRISLGGGNNRRLSVGGNMLQTPRPVSAHFARVTLNKKDDKTGAQSNARRGLDIGNLPMKRRTFNGRESDPTMARRPFSPISSTASLGASADLLDDQNMPHSDTIQKTIMEKETTQKLDTSMTPVTTPSKMIPAAEQENRTPYMTSTPVPTTPSTVPVTMQMSMTPAPPPWSLYGDNSVKETTEGIEYSFEERRAGFVQPITSQLRTVQV